MSSYIQDLDSVDYRIKREKDRIGLQPEECKKR